MNAYHRRAGHDATVAISIPYSLRSRHVVCAAFLGIILCAAPDSVAASAVPGSQASGAAASRDAETGAIRGRVFNPVTGEYLENARVTIESARLEALTDSAGEYRFSNVPAGRTEVKAFYTGRVVQTATVDVAAGRTVQQDFSLTGPGAQAPAGTVALPEFVVAAAREMDGAAIAINEQRFAPDIRNVVDANEFGPKGEGGIGEVLQFIPGMAISIGNGETSFAEMNGVPSEHVPVRINGFDLASARETTGRSVMLGNAPTSHSLSRIEVLHTPTPESPGSALAGSINLVPLSAFERSKPIFRSSVFVMFRDDESLTLKKTPGPGRDPTHKVHPGFNFTYIKPVNDRFGFTVAGGASRHYINHQNMLTTWRGVGAVTNGGTFPDTTPDRPYLTDYSTQFFSTDSKRRSLATTLDYRLGPNDRVSLSFNYVKSDQAIFNRSLVFAITRVLPGDFSTTATRGAAGAGTVSLANGTRAAVDEGFTPTLTYRHDGPIWRFDAGVGHSENTNHVRNASQGMFFGSNARRTGVTISFDGITALRPETITVIDAASGAPADPFDLNSYVLNTANFHTRDEDNERGNGVRAVQQSAFANMGRDLPWRTPVTIKAGLDVRRQTRDLTNGGQTALTFVGADGVASQTPASGDDIAGVVRDDNNSRVLPGFGFPAIDWVSNWKFYELYRSNPAFFRVNELSTYNSNTNNSKRAEELISAAYVRVDTRLIDGRLRLVGGLRAEQTNIEAQGPLNDATRNYQRDASGKIIRNANGQPLPITSDPVERARLTLIPRGMNVDKEYLRLFPSINASFNIRENLIGRIGHYYSVGRPNFNQYAGGITLPDTEAANQSNQRITVNNAGIKAWEAKTTKLSLEYYFSQVGLLSLGAWRRDFENFFGSVIFPATPEFLALYGIDPGMYGSYDVSTQHNLTDPVQMEGLDINYKQALTFLPHWARGLQIFANLSTVRAMGPAEANFANAVPRIYNGGISLSRERFNVKLNWNYRARNRLTPINANRGIAPDTYRWRASQLHFNFSSEVHLTRRVGLFATYTSEVHNDLEFANPATPSHARLNRRIQYGGLWTVGVNSSF